MNKDLFAHAARRFAALAEEPRLRLLDRLRSGPANVTTLARDTAIPQPSVTRHLATLHRAGFVHLQRSGNQVLCTIADPAVEQLCQLMCEGILRDASRHRDELDRLLPSRPVSARRTR